MFSLQPIRILCREKGCSLAEIERDLGIGNGVIAKWEKGKKSPPVDTLRKIADYFDVSLDLVCGRNMESLFPSFNASKKDQSISMKLQDINIPEDQIELNDLYMMMNEHAKKTMLTVARGLVSDPENLSKNNADTGVSA